MMEFHLIVTRCRNPRPHIWLAQAGNRAFGHREKIAPGCARRQAWYLQKLKLV